MLSLSVTKSLMFIVVDASGAIDSRRRLRMLVRLLIKM